MSAIDAVGRSIGTHRRICGLTLSGLSQNCGIARSALSQLELGQGNPTLETLWAIANALDVPFSQLLGDAPPSVEMKHAGASARFLERSIGEDGSVIETYRMSIEPGSIKSSAAHPVGVKETVVVTEGAALVGDARHPKRFSAGETYAFAADLPHVYGAIDRRAQMMVFVHYPPSSATEGGDAIVLDWPGSDTDWEGVRSLASRLLIEVANGVRVRLLRFRNCDSDEEAALLDLRAHALAELQQGTWPVHAFVGVDRHGPYLAVLSSQFTDAFDMRLDVDDPRGFMSQAVRLCRLAESPAAIAAGDDPSAGAPGWTMEALACEVALQRGELRLPRQLASLAGRENRKAAADTEDESFSSRIDVDHYDAFELLHPAYARQVVAMAQDILTFGEGEATRNAIDIGTGPGIPLLMLHELLPMQRTLAIEPDDVAFACLQENVRGVASIALHHGGFLEFCAPQGHAALLTSVGASHHFNTGLMLQKAMRLLRPGGILCIADEFLPEFGSASERDGALVRHHSAYILSAVASIERTGVRVPEDDDGSIFHAFRHALAMAVIDAECGQATRAAKRCRSLYAELRQSALDKQPAHAVGAFTRFFWLELQAMVAGFDYEVERKTFARRFVELGRLAGLELLRHRRVFATVRADHWGGGTHVLAFRRPLPL